MSGSPTCSVSISWIPLARSSLIEFLWAGFFINASVEIRAKRRLLEKNISFLHENDEKCMLQSLIIEITKRDMLDSKRKLSPLAPAKDAFIIDTSSIDADELLSIATNIIEGCSSKTD